MEITQALGMLGTFVSISTLIPQIIKMLKTKSVFDLSIATMFIQSICVSTWLAYGFMTDNIPLIVVNAVMITNTVIMIVLKIKYSKHHLQSSDL